MSRPVDKSGAIWALFITKRELGLDSGRLPRGTTAERRSKVWRRRRRIAVAVEQRMMMLGGLRLYIELDDGQVKQVDMLSWANWRAAHPDPHVAEDNVGRYRVSTVFLGLDHGHGRVPVLYETMVFAGGSLVDGGMARYTTRQEALAGHARMLRWAEALNASYEDEGASDGQTE